MSPEFPDELTDPPKLPRPWWIDLVFYGLNACWVAFLFLAAENRTTSMIWFFVGLELVAVVAIAWTIWKRVRR